MYSVGKMIKKTNGIEKIIYQKERGKMNRLSNPNQSNGLRYGKKTCICDISCWRVIYMT